MHNTVAGLEQANQRGPGIAYFASIKTQRRGVVRAPQEVGATYQVPATKTN